MKTISIGIANPVASGGTISGTYPSGETRTSYISSGATLSIGNNTYTTGFTLTLGASSFTVTNPGQAIAAGTSVRLSMKTPSDNAGRTVDALARTVGYVEYPGSPIGNVTPDFVGQEIQDTTTGTFYRAAAATAYGWRRVDPIQQLLTNLIGVKPVGMSVTPGSTAGRTWSVKLTAPGDYDAVQLFYYHHDTSATTVLQAIAAVTDEERTSTINQVTRPIQSGTENNTLDDTTTPLGWKSIKWAGAATKTSAAGTATAPAVNISDWLPLQSIARRDGSSQPFVLVRVSITGGTSSFTNGTATGTGMEAATSANAGFIMQSRWEADAARNMVTNPAANNLTAGASNNTITIGVRFRCRKRGISLLMIGDSLTQNGSTSIFSDGYSGVGLQTMQAICALGVPCGFINHGMASQTMQTFQPPGIAAITNWAPNAVTMQGFSPNNSYSSTGVAGYQIQQEASLVQEAIAATRAGMGVPLVTTGIPSSEGTIASAAIDTLRKNWNTIIRAMGGGTYVADWDLLTSDGSSPARLIAAADSGDGIHYNATYAALLAAQQVTAVRGAFGV